jgi:hypothetical protein
MAKPEWGTKRHCLHCGAAFYDLGKDPILCPKCGTQFLPDGILKPRRAKVEEKPVPVKKAPVKKAAEDMEDELIDDDATDDDLIEDAEDLEDEDVSEVIEGPDAKDPAD